MADSFGSRLRKAWNVFTGQNQDGARIDYGMSSGYRPDRPRPSRGIERTIVNSIYNRIAMDVASISIRHVQLDEEGRFLTERNSSLNYCLSTSANLDQTGRAFVQDVAMSLFDEGCVAVVPVDTDRDDEDHSYKAIYSLRVGQILEWYPRHVRVRLYNEKVGCKEDIVLPKEDVAIIENPFYSVMNQSNSIVQRLVRKLTLLDVVDEQISSGKLDLIIQLPYVIKTEARRQQAELRRKDIETQLMGSKYGIAYTDGTERITQLNRPVENNIMKSIEYLTNMAFGQLGLTQAIMDGSADEQTMLNYNNRTVEPVVAAIVDSMKRAFLSKTAISQRQSIMYFRDPFRLVPVSQVAEIADKFTRNEIMTSNEIRQIVGMRPSKDPKADELRNSNLNHPDEKQVQATDNTKKEEENQNGESDKEVRV